MYSITSCAVPEAKLLNAYLRDGTYVDCYATDIAKPVSQAQYVEAFYTTVVFKIERLLLKWAVSRPSTYAQAKRLAAGTINSFATWHVESRSENQLLLADFSRRTRSWLMVAPLPRNRGATTRLYFGSAIVPVTDSKTGRAGLGFRFRALLGFHKLYSKVLLYAARLRLEAVDR
ncbi:MAG: hypothetical protein WD944_12285 [Steroidobacteraceae bacterium]